MAVRKTFYEILEVSPSATEREIKAAYRKKAMKLHPDVNKAADAQERFMEAKVAYETLTDPGQRAEYDRRLRMGFGGTSGTGRSYAGSTGYRPPTGDWSSYTYSGTGTGFNPQDVGIDDLLKELEKEFTDWVNTRAKTKGKSPSTLWEELEDLGGELLDFLEDTLGIKDEPESGRKGSSSSSTSGFRSTSAYDEFVRQYGSPDTQQRYSSSSSAGSATNAPPQPPPPPPPPPKRSSEEEVEDMLKELKRKMGKL